MSTAYAATGVAHCLRRHRARLHRLSAAAQAGYVEWYCGCNGMIRAGVRYGPKSPQFKAARDRALYGIPIPVITRGMTIPAAWMSPAAM